MTIAATSLKWYLSGGATNSDPALSIGGAMSSVALSASALNNLFDDVTGDEAATGANEYRLLYFQNIDSDQLGLDNPILWITTQPPGDDDLAIGIAAAGKNAVEAAIANDYTAPAGVTFSAPATKGAGIALPGAPYVQNDYVGVWFRRHVPAGARVMLDDECAWAVEGDTV
jgi:hypothetical protein